MRKLLLAGLCVLLAYVLSAATDSDSLTVTLDVKAVGPYACFTDSVVTSAKEPYPAKKNGADKPLTYSQGNGASGWIYATIITNQPVTVSIGWNNLTSSKTSTTLPLSASSKSCTVTKAGASPGLSTDTSNTSVSPADDTASTEHILYLEEPEETASGTRVICHKIDLFISEESYLAANAADDYSTPMYLNVSSAS